MSVRGLLTVITIVIVFGCVALPTVADDQSQSVGLRTYGEAGGETYYALSLKPTAPAAAEARPQNLVVLFDTSASQIGAYRETALSALQQICSQLSPRDQIQLFAVDLKATPLIDGFVAGGSDSIDAGIARLQEEVPLGSTDMNAALLAAAEALESATDGRRAVVYIGDGMSAANLLESSQFAELTSKLRQLHAPVNSYAIGPQSDARLLFALANHTGGNLYVAGRPAAPDREAGITPARAREENQRRGHEVGRLLSEWSGATVYWPESISWPAELGTVYPEHPLPLRADRDTVVLGVTPSAWQSNVSLTTSVTDGHQPTTMTWTIGPPTDSDAQEDQAGIKSLVEMARHDGGVTLPTVGTAGLDEALRVLDAGVVDLTNLAKRAIARGDNEVAEQVSKTILRHDPTNPEAETIRRAATQRDNSDQNKSGQTKSLRLIHEAKFAQPLSPPPADTGSAGSASTTDGVFLEEVAEDGAFLSEVSKRRRVFAAMLKKEVENAIIDARGVFSSDPTKASQDLKLSLQKVRRAPELDAAVRSQLEDRLATAIREASRAIEVKDELDRERQEALASAERQQLIHAQLMLDIERKKQLLDRFGALLDERRFSEAQEVADYVEELYPDRPVPRVAALSARLKHHDYLMQVTRTARHRAYWDTLFTIEVSHIPFPDEPPIVYPDAEVWQDLTNRRKKYASVDLKTSGRAEQNINEALQGPLVRGLDYQDETLSVVMQDLEDDYQIEIVVDSRALEEVGLNPEMPVSANYRNITLRSALRLMLKELDLTYIVDNEVLTITTPEEAENRISAKVYPVADLVIPIQNIGMGMGGGMGGGMMGGGMGGGFFAVPDEPGATANQPVPSLTLRNENTPAAVAPSQPFAAANGAKSVEAISVDTSVPAQQFWNELFSIESPTPARIRQTVREMMAAADYDGVSTLIQTALRQGQPQPWMYETLGIAMQLAGQPRDQVERALMSAVDFSSSPQELMYIAQYLSRSGFDARAVQLLQQVVKLEPLRHEAYLLGLRAAQRAENMAGIQWATVGILSQAWPAEQLEVQRTAFRVARATLEQLQQEGKQEELARYQAQLDRAMIRDCVVRVTWTGDADVDLVVEEPSGSVCSMSQKRTSGGGVCLGDNFAQYDENSSGEFSESYICPSGFAGTYRVRVRRVWGEPTAGQVAVEVFTNFRTNSQKHETQFIKLGDDDAMVIFDLEHGRRIEPIEEQQLATAMQRQEAVNRAILAQRINSLADPNVIPNRAIFNNRANRLLLGGAGAVGFQPVIITLPEGTTFMAQGVISADRRYVRISTSPIFSGIGDVSTFTFSGSSGNQGGAGGGAVGGGGGGNAGGGNAGGGNAGGGGIAGGGGGGGGGGR